MAKDYKKNDGKFKKNTPPWNKGLIGYNKGHQVSDKTRKKIGEANSISLLGNTPWNKGKKLPYTVWNKGKKMSPQFVGKNVPNWKGDNVGYGALHSWVTRWKGEPNCCEMCGTEIAKKYEWANIDHQYHRVLEDFIRLCTTCHRKYDYQNNL